MRSRDASYVPTVFREVRVLEALTDVIRNYSRLGHPEKAWTATGVKRMLEREKNMACFLHEIIDILTHVMAEESRESNPAALIYRTRNLRAAFAPGGPAEEFLADLVSKRDSLPLDDHIANALAEGNPNRADFLRAQKARRTKSIEAPPGSGLILEPWLFP